MLFQYLKFDFFSTLGLVICISNIIFYILRISFKDHHAYTVASFTLVEEMRGRVLNIERDYLIQSLSHYKQIFR